MEKDDNTSLDNLQLLISLIRQDKSPKKRQKKSQEEEKKEDKKSGRKSSKKDDTMTSFEEFDKFNKQILKNLN